MLLVNYEEKENVDFDYELLSDANHDELFDKKQSIYSNAMTKQANGF